MSAAISLLTWYIIANTARFAKAIMFLYKMRLWSNGFNICGSNSETYNIFAHELGNPKLSYTTFNPCPHCYVFAPQLSASLYNTFLVLSVLSTMFFDDKTSTINKSRLGLSAFGVLDWSWILNPKQPVTCLCTCRWLLDACNLLLLLWRDVTYFFT